MLPQDCNAAGRAAESRYPRPPVGRPWPFRSGEGCIKFARHDGRIVYDECEHVCLSPKRDVVEPGGARILEHFPGLVELVQLGERRGEIRDWREELRIKPYRFPKRQDGLLILPERPRREPEAVERE